MSIIARDKLSLLCASKKATAGFLAQTLDVFLRLWIHVEANAMHSEICPKAFQSVRNLAGILLAGIDPVSQQDQCWVLRLLGYQRPAGCKQGFGQRGSALR